MKYKLNKNSGTYMYKKNNNFEGNRYFSSPNVKIHWSLTMNINQQYMYMLRFDIVRCVFLLFYVLMKHIILYARIQ